MTQNQRSLLINRENDLKEKVTHTGSIRYSYIDGKISLSPNLQYLLCVDQTADDINNEWSFSCFSEHTQKLLAKKIKKHEVNRSAFQLEVPINVSFSNEKWLMIYVEFVLKENKLCERITIFQDITKTIEQDKHSHYYHDRIALALSATNTGTWDYSVEKNFLFWDENMLQLFDSPLPQNKLKFFDWVTLVHPSDRDMFVDAFNAIHKSNNFDSTFELEFRTITPLGKIKHIKLNAKYYLNEFSEIDRIVGTCMDITATVESHTKLVEQATIAHQNAINAQQANNSKTQFIAKLSHEIKTPMQNILGTLNVLEKQLFEQQSIQLIDIASSSTKKLLHVINKLLDVSIVDNKKNDSFFNAFCVETLVNDTCKQNQMNLKPNLDIKTDIQGNIDFFREGDKHKLKQVVINLVNNAIKFSDKGTVVIGLMGTPSNITISVSDEGLGIEDKHLNLIFEPFKRVDESSNRLYGGAGLGLSVCKKLIQSMGGSICVDSEMGKGSIFSVTLPFQISQSLQFDHQDELIQRGNQPLNKYEESSKEPSNPPNLAGKKILCIVNNFKEARILGRFLHATQANCQIVHDINEALLYLRSTIDLDLIFLDTSLIDTLDDDVYKQIRAHNRCLPIIALSSSVSVEQSKEFIKKGFSYIIDKSAKFSELYSILHKLI